MGSPIEFWEKLAPYLSYIEDNFLDLEAIRKLQQHIGDPVLVVGAGQGLLVEELKNIGYTVDGIDNNPRMIEFAENRVIPASLQNLKKVCGGVFLGGAAGLTAQPISGV